MRRAGDYTSTTDWGSVMRRIKEVEGMYVTELCFRPNPHLRVEPLEEGRSSRKNRVVMYLPGRMTVREKGAEPVHLDPDYKEDNRAMLDDLPLYSFVYGSCLLQCTAEDDGTLVLELEHGRIEVPAFENAEAWEMHGGKGFRIICMPGGELAIWNEDSMTLNPGGDGSAA
jgi:hypothetical protein